MLRFPNAKVNIGLQVTAKRPDGYHDLQTVFLPIPLYDALEIIPAQEACDSITVSGLPTTGSMEGNLVGKAIQLVKERFPDRPFHCSVFLHKCIPSGAGMGGGSSDGTAMLLMMNDYFSLNLSKQDLLDMALTLGSDCPFFVHNTPCFAQGRGEQLTPVGLNMKGYKMHIICPEIPISTAEAFHGIVPTIPGFDLKEIANIPIVQWKRYVSNDFEDVLFKRYPILGVIKNQLYGAGALFASMTGTGSTLFGIFPMGAEKKTLHLPGLKFSEFYLLL